MAFPTGNSGFPKSLNVSAAIDRAAGAERQVIGEGKGRTGAAAQPNGGSTFSDDAYQWPGKFSVTAPATPEAQRWDGWGTSLKPAVEPIILARKPLSEKSVAANVCKHGVGAINIDATRVGTGDDRTSGGNPSRADFSAGSGMASTQRATGGRWPPNILTDGSPEVLAAFARFGESKARNGGTTNGHGPNDGWGMGAAVNPVYRDSGTAVRFFPALGYDADELRFMYCAKASRRERGEGNTHSTVKPLALMRWLTRLITPPGGTVLDCFAGSGTTGIACMREGFNAVLIERESEYVQMIQKRLGMCAADIQPNLFS